MNTSTCTPNAFSMQPKLATLAVIGLMLLSITFLGYHALRPVDRSAKVAASLPVEHCKRLFDVATSDSVLTVDADDAAACAAHFASRAKALPDTEFRVEGGNLEVRGGSFLLVGAEVHRTSYRVGEENLSAVLVVVDSTAATLRFQHGVEADSTVASIQTAAKDGK